MSLEGLVTGGGCAPNGASNALTGLADAVAQTVPGLAKTMGVDQVPYTPPTASVGAASDQLQMPQAPPAPFLASSSARASQRHSDLSEVEIADSFSSLDLTDEDLALLDAEYAEFAKSMDVKPSPASMDSYWQHAFWNTPGSSRATVTEYTFSKTNPFLSAGVDSGVSLHAAGRQLFEQGRLEEAIWAFEAAIQKGGVNLSDTWRWIGTAQAENDHDQVAILCLEKALEADHDNVEALLDLGVSYTNELDHSKAMKHLANWLRENKSYHAIPEMAQFQPPGGEKSLSVEPFESRHKRIIDMYIHASQINAADPDVWTVLGVLYNLSRDYSKAEEAFRNALKLDPNNYSLWNKLGATMANSTMVDGSKKAVYAYRKALELKPSYTRAWVNMGISYSNQNMCDLAAKYYLRALSLNSAADHVWEYLRIALDVYGNPKLQALVDKRNVDLFREHFTF